MLETNNKLEKICEERPKIKNKYNKEEIPTFKLDNDFKVAYSNEDYVKINPSPFIISKDGILLFEI